MFPTIKQTIFAFILFTGIFAWSGEVTQVKGTRALINLGGEPAAVGSEFFAVDGQGKRKAILKIKQVKGDRAIADVVRGNATAGMILQSRGGGSSSGSGAQESASTPKSGFFGKWLKKGTAAGILAGLSQNTMALTGKSGVFQEELKLAGNSYNLVGFYDYDFSSLLTFEGRFGLETFSVAGTTTMTPICKDSASCTVAFNYLSTAATLKVNLTHGSTRVWVGGGMAFLIAASKGSTNIFNLDTSAATNQMFTLGLGADIGLSGGAMIPVMLEMGMYPGSSSVKASSMIVRAGYGWRY